MLTMTTVEVQRLKTGNKWLNEVATRPDH